MAHLHNTPGDAAAPLDERLRRYLPAERVEDLAIDGEVPPAHLLETFIHLAAARYTITTYLPRLLVAQLLHERQESPWLRWVDGSLLFADLSGSTALAERLSLIGREGTERVTEFLNDIFTTLIEIVQSFGGDLVAFGGDALLVLFTGRRHPRTAVRAAMALLDALRGYVRSVPGVGEFPMHLHIGVESGPVAFVSAGQAHALYFGVLGQTVNAVANAEGRARAGEVVVGPGTWPKVARFAQGQPVGEGFCRIDAIKPAENPYEPLEQELPINLPPAEAIPVLLDDLDRISPYVPPALLERIVADPQRPQIEAELRPVSVLFAQTAGLEALAEALPPRRAARAIQRLIGAMQSAVEQFGGVVNKLDVADEGIKLVAIFGAPTAYEDHADRAALAALMMQDRLAALRRELEELLDTAETPDDALPQQVASTDALQPPAPSPQPSNTPLHLRIGINQGTVFAGNVGSAMRKEYTVMGDAVNVAARVMSAARWGEVWCSQSIAEAIEDHLEVESRGAMPLKGKAQPMPLFLLAGARAQITEPQPDHGPLIGREAELDMLRAHLSAALHGTGRAVRLIGDAGVGKSRLVTELTAAAQAEGMRVISTSCLSYTASIPYAAWGDWLRALCGIGPTDSEAVRESRLTDQLVALGPGMEEWLPLLGDLLRLDIRENRLTRGLDPQLRQTRRFELLEQLLVNAASERPLLALFEDLHWADPISLELWRRVTGAVTRRRVLLLGIHRPSPALDQLHDSAAILALRELSAEQSAHMIETLAGAASLPEATLRQIVGRASGNPLFLHELLRAVTDEQRSLEDLPESLNGLLLSRIDRLDETSRSVLRVASVIGQRVPFGTLRAIHNADQQALLRLLARLDEQELTTLETDQPEQIHAFRHALIQEVAYQSMLYARRRELHGRIGAYLERRHGSDLDDYYGLLAHHYRLSDDREKAVFYLLRAGHAARAVYANEEAIQSYSWALEALSDDADPRSWEGRDALGDVLMTIGRYDEAQAQYAAILSAPGIGADMAQRAHRKRGSVYEKQGHYNLAMEELDRAMTIARSGVPGISPLAVPTTCADIALVHKRRGTYDQAITACEEGLTAVRHDPRTREDELIEARLHSELGGIFGMRGNYLRARHHFEHSLELREKVDDLPGMTVSHNNLGYLWQLQSGYERALEHYQIAEELASKINLRQTLIFAANNAASALVNLCRYEEAREESVKALSIAQELGDRQNIANIYSTLAFILYVKGDHEASVKTYTDALQIYQNLGSVYQEANVLMNMSMPLQASGVFERAIASASQALASAETLNAQRLRIESLNILSELQSSHDMRLSNEYAHTARDLAESIGSKHDMGISLRILGLNSYRGGNAESHFFEESIALFTATGNSFEQARTWAAYGIALTEIEQHTQARSYLKKAQETFIQIGADGELQRLAPFFERSL